MSDEIRGEVKQILAPDDFDEYLVPNTVRDIDDDVYLVVIDEGAQTLPERVQSWLPFATHPHVHDLVLNEVWFAEGDTVTIDTEPLRITDTHDTLEARAGEAHYRTTAYRGRSDTDSDSLQFAYGLGVWSMVGLAFGTAAVGDVFGSTAATIFFIVTVVGIAFFENHVEAVSEWLADAFESDVDAGSETEPLDAAREAYLRGEIDEDEFEARVDDEFTDEEHEHAEERVVER